MAATMPPPTPAEIAADQGPGIIAGNLAVAVLATVAVALRFIARGVVGGVYGSDDWLMLAALPFGWGMAAATILAVYHGLGKHLNVLLYGDATKLVTEGQAYFASELIWTVSIPLIKISILLLYVRIFGRIKYFRYTAYALGAFTIAWAIMVVLVIIFQCDPIEKAWAPTTPGKCINSWLFFVIGSAMNCATDVALLVLPLPAVFRLMLSKVQKTLLVGIFILGSLSCVFGLVRLAIVIQDKDNPDATWSLSSVAIWSTAEPCLGITAACLPTIRPLFSKIRAQMTSGSRKEYALNQYGGSNKFGTSHSADSASSARGFNRISEPGSEPEFEAYVMSSKAEANKSNVFVQSTRIPKNAIAVETVTSWQTTGGKRKSMRSKY